MGTSVECRDIRRWDEFRVYSWAFIEMKIPINQKYESCYFVISDPVCKCVHVRVCKGDRHQTSQQDVLHFEKYHADTDNRHEALTRLRYYIIYIHTYIYIFINSEILILSIRLFMGHKKCWYIFIKWIFINNPLDSF